MENAELEVPAMPCSCVMLLASMVLVMGDIVARVLLEFSLLIAIGKGVVVKRSWKGGQSSRRQSFAVNMKKG